MFERRAHPGRCGRVQGVEGRTAFEPEAVWGDQRVRSDGRCVRFNRCREFDDAVSLARSIQDVVTTVEPFMLSRPSELAGCCAPPTVTPVTTMATMSDRNEDDGDGMMKAPVVGKLRQSATVRRQDSWCEATGTRAWGLGAVVQESVQTFQAVPGRNGSDSDRRDHDRRVRTHRRGSAQRAMNDATSAMSVANWMPTIQRKPVSSLRSRFPTF